MQARITAGLNSRATGAALRAFYGDSDTAVLVARERMMSVYGEHVRRYGRLDGLRFISAPGRTELAGNHTDHNLGKVLAAAVDMDCLIAASPNGTGIITLYSQGYNVLDSVDTADLGKKSSEIDRSSGIIRGICAKFSELGYNIGGFDGVCSSNVLKGSGLSSSAAFEVAVATALDCIYNSGSIPPMQKAQIARYAENEYFGKPCGLMDQAASAYGGLTAFDFGQDEPAAESLSYDFSKHGLSLVVVNTGSSHGDLTGDYAAIPAEMRSVAEFFGKSALRGLTSEDLLSNLPEIREKTGDRALLRAFHFIDENERVGGMIAALKSDDISEYLRLCNESGASSWQLLQNIHTGDKSCQPLALALAASQAILSGRGAARVHGGGFAGTIQAFVPREVMPSYIKTMDALFGKRSCFVLTARQRGAAEIELLTD